MTLRTIEAFIATVAPNRATVVFSPEFIAIFGSSIALKRRRAKPKSFRDAFYWWLLDNRQGLKDLLLLPENYNDWSDFSVYTDLLLFEQDLAYLTNAVLIFLESPGSIAELGAFSQIKSLSQRLIVVVKENHHPKKSFISLGPLCSIETTQSNCVCVIPDVKPEKLIEHVSVIIDMLDKKRSDVKSHGNFDDKNSQHQILLILDFINLFLVVQLNELESLANHFGVKIQRTRIKQILFLLERTRLVSVRRYGSIDYYSPQLFRQEYIDYTSKIWSRPFNRTTTKTYAWEEIKRDPYRKNILEAAFSRKNIK